MGVANSNNSANNATLDTFFSVINEQAYSHYHDADWLVKNAFCPEDSAHTMPCVGITTHGPSFVGVAAVTVLFKQLVTSFKDLTLAPEWPDRLYSADGVPVRIGMATTLSGTYVEPWFVKTRQSDLVSHYSKPLSDIPVYSDWEQQMSVPAFVVFAFADPAHPNLVSQFSLYLDRHKILTDLSPPSDQAFESWTRQLKHQSKRHG